MKRDIRDMGLALVKHSRLLQEYATKCFKEGKPEYGGEVAGKLRLLVARFGSNRPLLLDIIKELDIDTGIVLDGPPVDHGPGVPKAGDKISLDKFLVLDAVGTRIPTGEFVMLTKIQLIRGWAEQTGASHEDWAIDPALRAALEAPVHIMGLQATTQELRITTNAVLNVATKVIDELRHRDIIDA